MASFLRGPGAYALGLVVSLCLGGCEYAMDKTGPNAGQGELTINSPPMFLPQAFPDSVVPAAGNIPRSGQFVGTGRSLNNPGARCASNIRISQFMVNGDRIRFGAFRGTIAPDGRVDMQGGQTFIVGRFIGDEFEGTTWSPPPGCNYELSLRPAG